MFASLKRFRAYIKEKQPTLTSIIEWLLISLAIAAAVGSASAIFLISLTYATETRESNSWIIWLLPIVGVGIGYCFHRWGKSINAGNNLIIENIHKPKKTIPFKMAPFILLGTVVTHLFGGSAGREGTALQMGAAISDQITKLLKLGKQHRKIILISGMSAGFGSVFGTPLAGAIFGLEVYKVGKIRYNAIFPAFVSSIMGDYVTKLWGVDHAHYTLGIVPDIDMLNIALAIIAGVAFGLTALTFSKSTSKIAKFMADRVKSAPLRPLFGGVALLLLTLIVGSHKYLGLGVPTIVDSFLTQQSPEVFALKLLFTAITLGCGFKGGEVTPLFFIGATLGSALSLFIPLPMGLLAAMGFVALFAGASNTPLASSIMAIELFGVECGPYVAIACICSYLISGHSSIYSSQIIGEPKHPLKEGDKERTIKEI